MNNIEAATRGAELTIGKLAGQAKVNIQTIRYYERRGLLPNAPRSASNYRIYHFETVDRLRFIKRGQELGFSLNDIKELLDLRAAPASRCEQVRQRAELKLRDIDEKIRQLQGMRASLATVIQECSGRGPVTACSIFESLDRDK